MSRHDFRVPSSRSMAAMVVLGLVAVACEPAPTPTFDGRQIYKTYPFEPLGREWDFKADNTDVSYRMVMQQVNESVKQDSTEIWQLDVYAQCFNDDFACADLDEDGEAQDIDDTIIETWKISADFADGVRIWQMGDEIYEPPVVLAGGLAKVGSKVETVVGDITFTASYDGPEDCPGDYFEVEEGQTRVECEKVVVTDGEADSLVAGTYWSVAPFGLVQFTRESEDATTWSLRRFEDENSK